FVSTYPAHCELHSLSLHDALPICAVFLQRFVQPGRIEEVLADEDVAGGRPRRARKAPGQLAGGGHGLRVTPALLQGVREEEQRLDRKSTRLNSSHVSISYAVFCLK